MTKLEQQLADERLDVAEAALRRLLQIYKVKPRTSKDLAKLKRLETALQNLEVVRVM